MAERFEPPEFLRGPNYKAPAPNAVQRAVEALRRQGATSMIVGRDGEGMNLGVAPDPAEGVLFLVYARPCSYISLDPAQAWALADQLREVATSLNGGRRPV